MAEILPKDILLRVGGRTALGARHGVLAVAGARRGLSDVPVTFTRATVKRAYRDRDGTARRAAAGNMALDWPGGLVDASGNAIGGPSSEGARTQLMADQENFGAWVASGTPVLTSGQSDPFGGTAAYLINDDDAAAFEFIKHDVTFTGNGEKCCAMFLKQGTQAGTWMRLFDSTAGTTRHAVQVTWTAGVPSLATSSGTGTRFTPEPWGGNWYRVAFSATGIIAANVNRMDFGPGTIAASSDTGTVFAFGVNAWNATFPATYQAIGDGTGVADSFTSPFNWGPADDITVLVRLARPLNADFSGALGVSPGIFSFGAGAAARIGAYFDPAARNIISVIDTATTDATQTTAIPAGQPTICIQYKNLTTAGQTALDVGSGFTAFSSAATGFSAFSSQTLRIGRYDDELYGVVGDILVARGLRTKAEMEAVP